MRMRWFVLGGFAMLLAGCCYPNIQLGRSGGPSSFNDVAAEQEAIRYASVPGAFNTKIQVRNAVAIAIGESWLYTAGRNWHPEMPDRTDGGECCNVDADKPNPDPNRPHMPADRGLWQISATYFGPTAWRCATTDQEADNPPVAAVHAKCIYDLKGGGDAGWNAWDAWTKGASKLWAAYYSGTIQGWHSVATTVDQFCRTANPHPAWCDR